MNTEQNKRDIPPPPSGGSWTFDEVAWAWVSNDQAAIVENEPAADMAATHHDPEQE